VEVIDGDPNVDRLERATDRSSRKRRDISLWERLGLEKAWLANVHLHRLYAPFCITGDAQQITWERKIG
jgi:hypothetical protein